MMSSLNKVTLIRNLRANPEVRYRSTGVKVVTIRLATTERWKGVEGNKKEHTEWHRILFFRSLGPVNNYVIQM